MNKQPLPFLAFALLAFILSLWAGLLRLGWALPTPAPSLALVHGPMMVSGFLGALIALERAVALNQKWMFAAPFLAGLGWLVTLFLPNQHLGPCIFLLASLVFVVIMGVILWREPALHTVTMFFGALMWFQGNGFWHLGQPMYQAALYWQLFLVMTITGERLELNRVLRLSKNSRAAFVVIGMTFLLAALLAGPEPQWAFRMAGAGMVGLAVWSYWNDIAWRNIRHKLPLTRYIAWCLALGFIWLGIGGALSLVFGAQAAGPRYDALLHAVFVGFVISMIFGHAPIIFPAILGVPINFHPAFYIHLILLHLSLTVRVSGDLLLWSGVRAWGGMLNVIAILLFLGMTIRSVYQGVRSKDSKR